MKWWWTKKKNHDSFSVAQQTAKVTAIVHDKVLMKVEKALNLWMENVIFIAYAGLWWKSMICIVLLSLEIVHGNCMVQVLYIFIVLSSLWGLG